MTNKTIVFIDYANLRASVNALGMFLDLKILLDYFKTEHNLIEAKFYYGLDKKDLKSSSFLNKVTEFGYKVVTREVKYIRVNLAELFKKQLTRRVLDQLDIETKEKLLEVVKLFEKKRIPILIPKANMDSEMTMDMVLAKDMGDHYILFSGDGDFSPVIKYLIKNKKRVEVISLRGHTAGEIYKSGAKFIELRKFAESVEGLLKKQKPQRGS